MQRPAARAAGSGEVKPPKGLDPESLEVWADIAPRALEERTLTPSTAIGFGLLCSAIALERRLRASPLAVGGPDHRGMMQRVETGCARFRLTGDGKAATPAEEPKDEWSEFDGGLKVLPGGKP